MKKALLFTCLAILLVQLDATILYIAFSSIAGSFPEANPAQMAWVLNIYTLAFGSLLIPAGAAGDRFGRKGIFVAGVFIFTLSSFLCGLSQTVDQLIAMRLLQAIGAAMLVPTSLALLLAETPREKRSVAVSLWGASAALGAAVGPALGGLLISALGWHWVFYINVPVGLFVAASAYRNIAREPANENRSLPSFVGVFLIIAAMVCLSFAVLAEGGEINRQAGLAAAIGGLSLLGLFIWHCRKSERPLLDLTLFTEPTFAFANAASFFYFLSFSIIFFGNVQSLIHEWKQSVSATGLIMLPGPLLVIPSAILSGHYAKRHGHRGLLIAGSLIVLSGLALQLLAHDLSLSVFAAWLPGWLLMGIGNGMVMPSLASAATLHLPPHQYSAGSGVNNSIRQFGSLMGIAIAVAFIGDGNHGHDFYFRMFITAIGLLVLVAALTSKIQKGLVHAR